LRLQLYTYIVESFSDVRIILVVYSTCS